MKTSIKTLQDISGLPDLRTYTGSVKKSGKPALPTTAILDLYMRRNEKDRLLKELKRLKRRRQQLQGRLKDVEKEMNKLLEKATKTAVEIRGIPGKRGNPIRGSEKKERLVLRY
jgi:predicted nuclease with TOPRIM domain